MSKDTSNLITPGIKFTGHDGREYETTGEYRHPKRGETFLGSDDMVYTAPVDQPENRIILRELPPPAPPRRVPTDADAIHRPRCWVRDSEEHEWSGPKRLVAVLNGESHKFPFSVTDSIGNSGGCWAYCEIEDVPLGPVYHWRDATSEDLHQQFLIMNSGDNYWLNTHLTRFFFDDIKTGLRVLVEVGK